MSDSMKVGDCTHNTINLDGFGCVSQPGKCGDEKFIKCKECGTEFFSTHDSLVAENKRLRELINEADICLEEYSFMVKPPNKARVLRVRREITALTTGEQSEGEV